MPKLAVFFLATSGAQTCGVEPSREAFDRGLLVLRIVLGNLFRVTECPKVGSSSAGVYHCVYRGFSALSV